MLQTQTSCRGCTVLCNVSALKLRALPRRADKSSTAYGGGSSARGGYGGGAGGSKPKQEEGPGVAQQRFGNAKSISSSAFHGQDNQETEYEKQQRLSQFQVGAGWQPAYGYGIKSTAWPCMPAGHSCA